MIRDQKGFSLVELIVVMAVFICVIIITTDAFNVIVLQSSKLMKSEDSNIEGMIGLEQIRHDIQQGGYGLPHQFPATTPVYAEADGLPASAYNDAISGVPRVPRAFSSGNNLSGVGNIVSGSDYLAIRGTTVGSITATSSKRWTYLRYSSSTSKPNTWPSSIENIDNNAKVIVLNRTFSNGLYTNLLVTNSSLAANPDSVDYFSAAYGADGLKNSAGSASTAAFNPASPNALHFIYGIDNNSIRMPFNRTDYFVSRPDNIPTICAPSSGILYKTIVRHSDGELTYIPLVDCVADMQIVYGWDLKNSGLAGNDGLIDTYSNADGSSVSGQASIAEVQACMAVGASECIRTSLKLIKVYLLVQNGGRDKNYTSPTSFDMFDTGESALGRTYTLTTTMLNYRWKVYRVVVRPKNLESNQ